MERDLGRDSFVGDAEAREGEPRVVDVDELGVGSDEVEIATSADDLGLLGEIGMLEEEPSNHPFDEADVAEDEARLDGVDGIAPKGMEWSGDGDLAELGCPAGEGVGG